MQTRFFNDLNTAKMSGTATVTGKSLTYVHMSTHEGNVLTSCAYRRAVSEFPLTHGFHVLVSNH